MSLSIDRSYGGRRPWDGIEITYPDNPRGRGFYVDENEALGQPLPNLEHPNAPIRRWDDFTPEQIASASPFRYPRNPCGRGYIVEPDTTALDALMLPNFEDPSDPLSPDRLLLLDPERWPVQPAPAGFGWLDYGWFPRVAWFGCVPDYDPNIEPQSVSEIRQGHCAPDILQEQAPSLRCVNGASLGLSVPYLAGNEEVELLNMHPRAARFSFLLPGERPRLSVDGREGNLVETEPVIQTVDIDLTRELVRIVWRGSALARRIYLDKIANMPFAVQWPC